MPLRIAVIGLGHMGRIHLSKLVTFTEVEVSAVSDVDSTCLKEISEKTGIMGCSGIHDVIKACDCVLIASPTETHYAVGKAFLDAGKHVFMEKPITVTTQEAEELIGIAAGNNLVFQIGHLERFNPAFSRASHLIQKPVLIEATRISPFTGRSTDVDVVLDLMIHDLDLVLSVAGNDVVSLSAQGVCFMTDKLDAVAARILFASGCVANITASRISPRKERSIAVYENDQSLSIDLLQGKFVSIAKNGNGIVETTEYTAEKIDPVSDELNDFIRSIRQKAVPNVTGSDGLKALRLAAKIKEDIAEKHRAV